MRQSAHQLVIYRVCPRICQGEIILKIAKLEPLMFIQVAAYRPNNKLHSFVAESEEES